MEESKNVETVSLYNCNLSMEWDLHTPSRKSSQVRQPYGSLSNVPDLT
jgi:hypothetical protein